MALDALVTGAAGVLGRHIVGDLRSAGYDVLACGRLPGQCADTCWDVSQQDEPEPDCHPAVVVHAAAKVGSYRHPLEEASELFDVNVTGALRVARWCVSHRVKRLVLISGAIVYGEWFDSPKRETDPVKPWVAGPYAVSKFCGEQVAYLTRAEGCELTILRFSSLYGTGYAKGLIQRLTGLGQETGCIQLTAPVEDGFDLLHLYDAARAVRRAIEAEKTGMWNVGSGSLTTIGELGEACAEAVNARVEIAGMDSPRRPRVINWVDDGMARRELGHTNETPLTSGIAEILESMGRVSLP